MEGSIKDRFSRWLQFGRSSSFLDRRQDIPDSLVKSLWLPEVLHFVALKIKSRFGWAFFAELLQVISMRFYGCLAKVHVRAAHRNGVVLYHYRAGFGHESVKLAKTLGMFTICDHSTVHPALFDYLSENAGRFPGAPLPRPHSLFWANILKDIELADIVLVNSSFVKATYESQAWSGAPIEILYLGIYDNFVDGAANISPARQLGQHKDGDRVTRFIFAGAVSECKGFSTIVSAFQNIDQENIHLTVAGSLDAEHQKRYQHFLEKPNVTMVGWTSRSKLSQLMEASDVLVFPSYTEGSARVVFEAMACGCYVITTENSGSIVEPGVHGALIKPGNPIQLKEALLYAKNNKERVTEIGKFNKDFVARHYGPDDYERNLSSLYNRCEKRAACLGGSR